MLERSFVWIGRFGQLAFVATFGVSLALGMAYWLGALRPALSLLWLSAGGYCFGVVASYCVFLWAISHRVDKRVAVRTLVWVHAAHISMVVHALLVGLVLDRIA